jgi:hypothetical protein
MEQPNTKFVVLKKGDCTTLNSFDEASQYLSIIKDQHPEEEYEILEVHPPRPRGMGRDPDLH